MHIEPELVTGAKLLLSYATATVSLGLVARASLKAIKEEGISKLAIRSLMSVIAVFAFFELFIHHSVGVSEVHLILGSSLFLLLGPAAAGIGLMGGLLIQGMFFAPIDLPQYGMNVTTLLLPLFVMSELAKRIIPQNTKYVDLNYSQTLKLSFAYQGGIIAWVAFWAIYGQGLEASNLISVATFSGAYLSVILLEPLVDLGLLALAKTLCNFSVSALFEKRLYASQA
ncbi:energy-coupling factor ABC transporter permease [Marinomonas sp. 15G1-11]|uniref:Energy-coupling factor ABC transporter permease n=1 Tax=Marinomonas phaeophyticola TaxID=3004091 RepID=A0ABT4JZK5_9GAMM|nr:energy-coupling factor ABC transporter permease [Marinomonas sp. 15G1-11]MCZ2723542.1 energy-coupling factor ABC transporter permease [Marinomonas sp. 15G1-11]